MTEAFFMYYPGYANKIKTVSKKRNVLFEINELDNNLKSDIRKIKTFYKFLFKKDLKFSEDKPT